MKSVKKVWEEVAKELEEVYDLREAQNISYILLEDLFGISKTDVMLDENREVDDQLLSKCILSLQNHVPVQYITGVVHFFGRMFSIKSGALIPRPETEELVDLILKENTLDKPKILDIGVGSGCIAITLALETNGDVFGTDVSTAALEIASGNSSKLRANVKLQKHNILKEDLPVFDLDILVSNPPYIPASDKKDMNLNVVGNEPELALFVPDDDPLIFYKKISEAGVKSLKRGGRLYFEIHERYGEEVRSLLEKLGYDHVIVHQDMQGKDRMISSAKA